MKTDISQKVMEKVMDLEKRRVLRWQAVFWTVVGVLAVIALALLWQAWQVIQERGTLDLLTVLTEDQEIVAEFWQDTLATFIEELPQRRLELTALVVGILALVFLVTKRARRIIQKKSETFSKFKAY